MDRMAASAAKAARSTSESSSRGSSHSASVTISIGLAASAEKSSLPAMMHAADQALYRRSVAAEIA